MTIVWTLSTGTPTLVDRTSVVSGIVRTLYPRASLAHKTNGSYGWYQTFARVNANDRNWSRGAGPVGARWKAGLAFARPKMVVQGPRAFSEIVVTKPDPPAPPLPHVG